MIDRAAEFGVPGLGELDDFIIEVETAEVSVSGRCQNGEVVVRDVHERDVEGSATKVIHEHFAAVAALEPEAQRCRRWLIDDLENVETGDLARLTGGRPFRIAEVGRHSDHHVVDGLTEKL